MARRKSINDIEKQRMRIQAEAERRFYESAQREGYQSARTQRYARRIVKADNTATRYRNNIWRHFTRNEKALADLGVTRNDWNKLGTSRKVYMGLSNG